MAFSRITYSYSGQTTFAINFTLGYLDESHVTARVNEEIDGQGNPVYRTITFITTGTCSISGTWESGDTVVFQRTTPKNILQHDYQNGALLIESNLDESNKQAIMIAHEALDGRLETVEGNLNMGSNKITNLADGVADSDAVTLGQIGNAPAEAAAAAVSAAEALVAQTAAETAQTAAELAASNLPKNNFVATTAPTGTNDTTEGYSTGSRWIDITAPEAYTLVDDSVVGSAVWVEDTLIASDLGSAALLGSVDEDDMSSDSNTLLPTQQSVKAYVDNKRKVFHVQEQQSAGTGGGTFTQDDWQTRGLNTSILNEITGASLATNQITLPAGTYIIEGYGIGFRCDEHKTRLRNITDSTTDAVGSNCFSNDTADYTTNASSFRIKLTIAGTKVFELQHRCTDTHATEGLGRAANVGEVEIYSELFIEKL